MIILMLQEKKDQNESMSLRHNWKCRCTYCNHLLKRKIKEVYYEEKPDEVHIDTALLQGNTV